MVIEVVEVELVGAGEQSIELHLQGVARVVAMSGFVVHDDVADAQVEDAVQESAVELGEDGELALDVGQGVDAPS